MIKDITRYDEGRYRAMFNVYNRITYKQYESFVAIESHPMNLNQTTTILIIPGKLENGTTLSKLLNKGNVLSDKSRDNDEY